MKSLPILAATFFVMITCAFTVTVPPQSVDVFTALDKKMIAVTAESNGLNSEECATIKVRNLTAEKLQIRFPAGTLLNTENENEQNILVTKPAEVFVENQSSASKPLYGFCCQASNGVPTSGSVFKVEKCSNENLSKLAQHLGGKPYDPELQQAAIWAVSDKHSVGGIYNDNKAQCEDLREFTAGILKQPVPFYDVDYGYEPNTPFVFEPKTLEGTMNYRLASAGKASLAIYEPGGNLYHVFYNNKQMDWGFYTQNFSFTATDMIAGDYTVVLVVNGQLVNKQTITL